MDKENKTIHITDLGVDLTCVIDERNAYDNNAVTIFFDETDYLNHIDSVARMSDVVAEQNNTSKTISGIYVTQRLQNVYPLFNIDELVRFRGMILNGISKELQLSRPISVDELKEAHGRFIDDEIKLCSVLRDAINKYLSAPHLRTSRFGALSIIDSYEAQLKDAIEPRKGVEINPDKRVIYDSSLTDNELAAIFSSLKADKFIEGAEFAFIQMVRHKPIDSTDKLKWIKVAQRGKVLSKASLINLLCLIYNIEPKPKTDERCFVNYQAKIYFDVDLKSNNYSSQDDHSEYSKILQKIITDR